MKPLLEQYQLEMLTVSTDSVKEIKLSRKMHGFKGTMLGDTKSQIINKFGLKNQNRNNFRMPWRPDLPVPTTLLIDSNGTVIWKDQADQYSKRSDPECIRSILEEHFS